MLALAGSLGELVLVGHTESAVQLVPFVMASAGLVVCLALARYPSRRMVQLTRLTAAVLIAGSLYGVYEHFAGNVALELEIRPSAERSDVVLDALLGGVPLFAPGILALAGAAAAAATIDHPGLRPRD